MSDTAAPVTLYSRLAMFATHLLTRRYGELVGTDTLGNKYYQDARGKTPRPFDTTLYRQKRWVIYHGEPEASKVPPEWHAWLHYQTNDKPSMENPLRRDWQQPHQINLTGSDDAYRPPGHVLQGEKRAASTSDYEPWTPA